MGCLPAGAGSASDTMVDRKAADPELRYRTGNSAVDEVLTRLVAVFEAAFPDRVRNYALLGSFAEGTAFPTSDVDVVVLFRGDFGGDEEGRAQEVAAKISETSGGNLDVGLAAEGSINPIWQVNLQAGRELFGRTPLPDSLPPISSYGWALVEDVFSMIRQLRQGEAVITHPLSFPQGELELYGYEAKPLRDSTGRWAPSTKALSMITSRGASALLALEASVYTKTRSEAIVAYRTHIGDRWADLVEETERLCRDELAYRIPTDANDRARVKEIARRLLDFENDVVERCRVTVLSRLKSRDQSDQSQAIRVMEDVSYTDDEALDVLSSLAESGDEEIARLSGSLLGLLRSHRVA